MVIYVGKLQVVILDKIYMLEVSKDISFLGFKNKFSKFVRFLYFLTDLNSRGIILNIIHKIKQKDGGQKHEKFKK